MNLRRIPQYILDPFRIARCRLGLGKKPKVFGIGRNKTGTTSLQSALTSAGYQVAPTQRGEMKLMNWANQDYQPIISMCKNYDAFQDVPFSLPGMYQILDKAFPDGKFVLTVRDSADEWFDSLVRFHSKRFGGGQVPTWTDLEESKYRRPGFLADCQRLVYGADECGLYNPEAYKRHYENYNQEARDYFADKPGRFLELNVKEEHAYRKLCDFLNIKTSQTDFPWLNRSGS